MNSDKSRLAFGITLGLAIVLLISSVYSTWRTKEIDYSFIMVIVLLTMSYWAYRKI